MPKVFKPDPDLVALEKKYLGTTTLDKPRAQAQEFNPQKLFDEIANFENVYLTNELYLRMENITLSKLMEKDKVNVALMLANKELEKRHLEEKAKLQEERIKQLEQAPTQTQNLPPDLLVQLVQAL